jgi:hypothetical protein
MSRLLPAAWRRCLRDTPFFHSAERSLREAQAMPRSTRSIRRPLRLTDLQADPQNVNRGTDRGPARGSRSRHRSPSEGARDRGQPRWGTRPGVGPRHAKQLRADGLDLSAFWTADEFATLFAETKTGLTDENAVVEPGPTDIVRGDVLVLGRHRLLCGDATSADDVTRLLDASADDNRSAVRSFVRSGLAASREPLAADGRWARGE